MEQPDRRGSLRALKMLETMSICSHLMNGLRYLVIEPGGAVSAKFAATGDDLADALQVHLCGDDVECIDVAPDLRMYHVQGKRAPASENPLAAVVVAAHWGRTPRRYTGTVIFTGGGQAGQVPATLGDDVEQHIRGLADFVRRRTGLTGDASSLDTQMPWSTE